MVIRIPTTERMIFPANHSGDIVINMNEYLEVDEDLRKTDVPKIGNYEKDGVTNIVNVAEVTFAGTQKDMGIWLESAGEINYNELNNRGNRISTHREKDKTITLSIQ